jgi:RNA-binding protein
MKGTPVDDLAPLPPPVLTGKQARALRARGHGLEPLVTVGKEGVTAGVVDSLEANLAAHELVKVRIAQGCGADRHEVAAALAAATRAAVAQVLGRTVLLYRPALDRKAGAQPCAPTTCGDRPGDAS